jgi:predicted ester cyclase
MIPVAAFGCGTSIRREPIALKCFPEPKECPVAEQQKMKEPGPVLQVERRDYIDLVPTDRPRAHGMRGFDPVYTDIVDYIIRCTHRIWDERDIGLIYSHYTHNAVIYYPLGTIYNREDIVRDTIQRLVTFPERRGMATHVIWRGDSEPDLSLAHTDTEARVLRDLHEIYNKRMFGRIKEIYAPQAQWHGPLMKEIYGRAGVLHQTMALVGSIPDCAFTPQHICSVPCEEGGEKVAVRWTMEGHHLGWALLGKPTGHRIFVMGITHLHIVDGKIVEDWTLYDELAMLTQIKLGQMAQG